MTRVVLAAAHLDSDPTNNRLKNLRALCQRCHMLHDRPHHLAQRWITYRRRLAVGDLFLGLYPAMIAALTFKRASQVAIRRGLANESRPSPDAGGLSRPAARAALCPNQCRVAAFALACARKKRIISRLASGPRASV